MQKVLWWRAFRSYHQFFEVGWRGCADSDVVGPRQFYLYSLKVLLCSQFHLDLFLVILVFGVF